MMSMNSQMDEITGEGRTRTERSKKLNRESGLQGNRQHGQQWKERDHNYEVSRGVCTKHAEKV